MEESTIDRQPCWLPEDIARFLVVEEMLVAVLRKWIDKVKVQQPDVRATLYRHLPPDLADIPSKSFYLQAMLPEKHRSLALSVQAIAHPPGSSARFMLDFTSCKSNHDDDDEGIEFSFESWSSSDDWPRLTDELVEKLRDRTEMIMEEFEKFVALMRTSDRWPLQ